MPDERTPEPLPLIDEARAISTRLPLVVAISCLLLTLLVSEQLQGTLVETNRSKTQVLANRVVQDLGARLTAYEVMLRSASSFIGNDPGFDAETFDGFVTGSNLLATYPGLRAVGYAEWVEGRDEPSLIVRYLEPSPGPNDQAIGFNLLADGARKRAALEALTTALPTTTSPVLLTQDRLAGLDEPGFLMLAPVYDSAVPPPEGSRKAHIRGFVYVACRGTELVGSVFPKGPPLSFAATDEGIPILRSPAKVRALRSVPNQRKFLTVAGRQWRFDMGPPAQTDWSLDPTPFVWWIGLVVSVVLGGLVSIEQRRRVRAEDVTVQLRLSEQALLSSEERYRVFVASSLDGIWRLELDEPMPCSLEPDSQIQWIHGHGTVGECNDAFAQMCGRGIAGEIRNCPVSEVLDPSLDWTRALLVAFVHAGYRIARFEVEQTIGGKPEARLHSLVGDVREGSLYRAWGVVRSVTAERLAQRKIESLNEELEGRVEARTRELIDANRELESFAYSVSHDLRTPLRGMAGFSKILEEDYGARLDEEGRGHLQRIRSAAVRLGGLIDGLLMFSRLARAELKVQDVDVSAIAARVAADLRSASENRNAEVTIESGLTARADPLLIEVLIQNLLGNALKFSAREAHPKVEFGATRVKGRLEFFVRDNGVGFDGRYADRLFRPFERLHKDAEFPGTGIGLATVQRIVHRHRGEIRAEGTMGGGAVIRFTLG